MKTRNLIRGWVWLVMFITLAHAQQPKNMFYGTIQTSDAIALRKNHPEDIKILASKQGYSAVMLSDDAAEELHHKVLVHGPGFVYESSEKSAYQAIDKILKAKTKTQRANFSITQDQLVLQSLDLVDNMNIAAQIQELEAYGTRYHTTANATKSVEDLKVKWETMAAGRSDVSVRIVNHTSTNMPSVIMTITGTEKPDEFVIIGGHIDSTAGGGNINNAPGADDNASGISTFTEAARVLFEMNFKPKRTLEFMAFAAEEVGLRGSKEIAEDYGLRNVNVISYLQLDMTNYNGSVNDLYISTDTYNDDVLNDFLIELMNYYNSSGPHRITYGTSRCNYGCSDHYSWAQQGYNVAFPFEAAFREANPNIHTPRDTFDRSPTPNATHAAKFAKLALEYLIEIGNGTSGTPPPPPPSDEVCSGDVSAFPYTQSFEGSIGDWAQSSADDLDWEVNSGGTPSNSTGPSSAADGNSYLYVEASGDGTGFPNKRAVLNSPCIDLSTIGAPALDLQYHMYGSAINSLIIQGRTNNTGDWTTLFNQTGDQGNTWNATRVDLSAYAGQSSVQLRIEVLTGEGSDGWQSDIAIDGLQVLDTTSVPPPPPPSSCDEIVNGFPYEESFEGSLGLWTQDSDDDTDWTVDANGTPSNNTGPSSAADGNSYIYVEASGNGTGFPNKVARLNSPCYDFSGAADLTLEFQYHMYGSAINSLEVEASTASDSIWNTIFSETGDQGNTWNSAAVDLSAYVDQADVQLRFVVTTGSGSSGWQSDIAIDAVRIADGDIGPPPPPPVCNSLDFTNYTISSFSNQDNDGDFSIEATGASLTLTNNTWKYIPYNYTVTSNTVVEFDFSSSAQGEIHGIGFENDNSLTSSRYFKVHGTQRYGVTNYDNYTSGTITYTIPVGDFYTGSMDRLVFINDNDANGGNTSTFSNVKVYEGSCLDTGRAPVVFASETPILGDEDEKDGLTFSIIPNPTQGRFTIMIPNQGTERFEAYIYDILGRKKAKLELSSGSNTLQAQELSLTQGIYLVKIKVNEEQAVLKKLVIHK